jgi:hypothetical protein
MNDEIVNDSIVVQSPQQQPIQQKPNHNNTSIAKIATTATRIEPTTRISSSTAKTTTIAEHDNTEQKQQHQEKKHTFSRDTPSLTFMYVCNLTDLAL